MTTPPPDNDWWDQPLHELYEFTPEELYKAFKKRFLEEIKNEIKQAVNESDT